jgi:hypothetical protein
MRDKRLMVAMAEVEAASVATVEIEEVVSGK